VASISLDPPLEVPFGDAVGLGSLRRGPAVNQYVLDDLAALRGGDIADIGRNLAHFRTPTGYAA
jgi:hypothetical protein